jgi:hypothetical protein
MLFAFGNKNMENGRGNYRTPYIILQILRRFFGIILGEKFIFAVK